MTEALDGQVSLCDLGIWSGKMYPEHSAATSRTDSETSEPCWKKLSASQSQTFLFLDCRTSRNGRNRGGIVGDGWSVAWRTHDAQFWGVPQRRRRISMVVDFNGHTAGDILFERIGETERSGGDETITDFGRESRPEVQPDGEGVCGDSPESGTAREEIAGGAESGSGTPIFCFDMTHANDAIRESRDVSPSLQARMGTGGNQIPLTYGIGNGQAAEAASMAVRRLTPLECERLQGYPDGWTDIGEWTDGKGKKHRPADAPRYKALGNSIALPFWRWMFERMAAYLPDDATLGSLFDGIGGFPLCWESIHGKGTARFASEIEDFPIAVTKHHFGGNADDR